MREPVLAAQHVGDGGAQRGLRRHERSRRRGESLEISDCRLEGRLATAAECLEKDEITTARGLLGDEEARRLTGLVGEIRRATFEQEERGGRAPRRQPPEHLVAGEEIVGRHRGVSPRVF